MRQVAGHRGENGPVFQPDINQNLEELTSSCQCLSTRVPCNGEAEGLKCFDVV